MNPIGETAQIRLQKSLSVLTPQQIEQVADYAEYLHSKEEWEATQELLSNPKMRQAVEEGLQQIQEGKTRPWREFRNDV